MKTLFIVSMVLLAILFIDCSNSSERKYVEQNTPSTSNSTEKQIKSSYQDNPDTVIIQQMKFIPDVLYANVGDTITFINKDFVKHDVTEETTRRWFSTELNYGDSWSMVVSQSEDYFCSLHVIMKGKIVAKQNSDENI